MRYLTCGATCSLLLIYALRSSADPTLASISERGSMGAGRKKLPLSLLSPNVMRDHDGKPISGRNVLVSPRRKWPDGIVYFQFDPNSTFTDADKEAIYAGMQEIAGSSCIMFVERSTETSYLNIMNNNQNYGGCWAEFGYQDKPQNAHLPSECLYATSTPIHIFMIALGFIHEQTRYDRDLYVEVIWDNINVNQTHNFYKYPRTYAFPLFDYDFSSLMQFDLKGFGIDGRRSLDLAPDYQHLDAELIGWASHLSRSDIYRIRSAYKCSLYSVERTSVA